MLVKCDVCGWTGYLVSDAHSCPNQFGKDGQPCRASEEHLQPVETALSRARAQAGH